MRLKKQDILDILVALHNSNEALASTLRSEFQSDVNDAPELRDDDYLAGKKILDKHIELVNEGLEKAAKAK